MFQEMIMPIWPGRSETPQTNYWRARAEFLHAIGQGINSYRHQKDRRIDDFSRTRGTDHRIHTWQDQGQLLLHSPQRRCHNPARQ